MLFSPRQLASREVTHYAIPLTSALPTARAVVLWPELLLPVRSIATYICSQPFWVLGGGPERTRHREGIGLYASLHPRPTDRRGNRKSFADPRRIGPDRGGAATVAQIVEEDAAMPG